MHRLVCFPSLTYLLVCTVDDDYWSVYNHDVTQLVVDMRRLIPLRPRPSKWMCVSLAQSLTLINCKTYAALTHSQLIPAHACASEPGSGVLSAYRCAVTMQRHTLQRILHRITRCTVQHPQLRAFSTPYCVSDCHTIKYVPHSSASTMCRF
jgi:hypothetical protein